MRRRPTTGGATATGDDKHNHEREDSDSGDWRDSDGRDDDSGGGQSDTYG